MILQEPAGTDFIEKKVRERLIKSNSEGAIYQASVTQPELLPGVINIYAYLMHKCGILFGNCGTAGIPLEGGIYGRQYKYFNQRE